MQLEDNNLPWRKNCCPVSSFAVVRVGVFLTGPRWRLIVDTGLLLLLLYGCLDGSGVGEGHPFELEGPSGVGDYGEGAVDQAVYPYCRDALDAHHLDVLALPAATQLYPVGVDADDVVTVSRGLGNGLPM